MPAQNTASPKRRSNLFLRKLSWYARYYVPKELQPVVGKREVVRTLNTRDKLIANQRHPTVLSELQREVAEQARSQLPTDPRSATAGIRELEALEDAVRRDRSIDADHVSRVVELTVERHYDTFSDEDRCFETGTPYEASGDVLDTARRVIKVAHDPDYRSISDWLREHLVSMETEGLVKSTRSKRERAINEFIAFSGSRRDPRTLRSPDVVKFGDHLRTKGAWSTRVKKDVATNAHTFFEWLRKNRRIIDTNHFHGLSEQIEGSRNSGGAVKRAWHPEELQRIVTGLNPNSRLWSIAMIALYSGMRINEVCSLEVDHVTKRGMAVTPANAKNTNSVRTVPIHPVIAPLVEKLVSNSYDGFLISGLKLAGQDQRRGAYPSKRFSEVRKMLGSPHPRPLFTPSATTSLLQGSAVGFPSPH